MGVVNIELNTSEKSFDFLLSLVVSIDEILWFVERDLASNG